MNPTNNKNLPSRLRESSFRRYEATIKHIVERFPEVVVHTNSYGSLVTFASRLRDAMASLATYRWTSELVNMDKFEEHYPAIKVSHVMCDRVVVGSSEHIRNYYTMHNLPPSQFECFTPTSIPVAASAKLSVSTGTSMNETTPVIVKVSLSQDTHDKGVELKLLAGLAALRLLANVVQIEIDSEQAQYLEENFDVVVTKVTDTKYNLQ